MCVWGWGGGGGGEGGGGTGGRVLIFFFFLKEYVVGTYLNCIDKSIQSKWVPTTYACIKK